MDKKMALEFTCHNHSKQKEEGLPLEGRTLRCFAEHHQHGAALHEAAEAKDGAHQQADHLGTSHPSLSNGSLAQGRKQLRTIWDHY